MRSARFIVDSYARSKIVWRKLDEAEPRYGLPRKQFSKGFHAVGGLEFRLTTRAGRPTFSAEDLLDLAVQSGGYEVVALYGKHGNNQLATGATACDRLAASYGSAERGRRIITIP